MYPGGKAAGGEQQSWGEASLGLPCLVHWEPFPVGWAQQGQAELMPMLPSGRHTGALKGLVVADRSGLKAGGSRATTGPRQPVHTASTPELEPGASQLRHSVSLITPK